MATIRKRVGLRDTRWEVRIRRADHPTVSKTFSTRTAASKWALKTDRAIEAGELVPFSIAEETISTLGELLVRYRDTISSQKKGGRREVYKLDMMLRYPIAKATVGTIGPAHIAHYRDTRLRLASTGTVLKELQLLSHAIEIGRREWGLRMTQNPVKAIRKPTPPKARDRRLVQDDDEERRLLEACGTFSNQWFVPVIQFAIETGMRRGEILSLHWQDVHLDRSFVHLRDTKNGDSRDVPLTPKAIDILQQLNEKGISNRMEAVFPIHFEALKSAWRRATRKAGIDDLRFHDLRHEATSRFFEKGLNVMEVAAITGHKDLRMLQRYTHLRAEDLAKKLL